MEQLDYIVLGAYFFVLIAIGFWGHARVKSSADFYTAGGKLPWWLSGVSHHVSGYSGVVFVAYAAIAYTHGFTVYIWWAVSIAIAMVGTIWLIAPRWARLRESAGIQSPTEYLATRYNLPTQQVMAWTGVLVKMFDVGAKWASIGILFHGFTGFPMIWGVLSAGVVTLVYITIGGLWADVLNDMASFIIQVVVSIFLVVIVLIELGDDISGFFTLWDRLPAAHSQPFNEPYTATFAISFMVICFFSYSGGTWNLATRFISSPSGSEARKAATLSMLLYLFWPLVLFFPMFAAPVLMPGLEDPEQSYALLSLKYLPTGLAGLLLASMFANTLTMTGSDSNTISAVITRDILPVVNKKIKTFSSKKMLLLARITTFTFIFITLVIGLESQSFGGVIGLVLSWFSALLGPIAIPMILGLLPQFRRSNSQAALLSIGGGILAFVIMRLFFEPSLAAGLAVPSGISLVIFVGYSLLSRKEPSPAVDELLSSLDKDQIKP